MLISSFKVNAQVGINTDTPEAMLDVNGSMQVRKSINVGGVFAKEGDAGDKNSVLVSNGPGVAPSWRNFDASGGLRFAQSVMATDDKGVVFYSASKVDDYNSFEMNEDLVGWSEIEGLRSYIYINKDKNVLMFSLQTTMQSPSNEENVFAIVAIGIFIDDQLKFTRTSQINGNSSTYFPIEIIDQVENLPSKENDEPYEIKVAAKLRYFDFPFLSSFPSNVNLRQILVGCSNSNAINTTPFMNQTSMGVDLFEEV